MYQIDIFLLYENDEKIQTIHMLFLWISIKLLIGNTGKLTFPDPESPTRTIFSFLTTSSSSMSDIGKIGIKGAREEETRRDTKSFGLSCEKSCWPRDGSTSTIIQHINEGSGMWLENEIERIDRPAVASATSSSI